MEDYVIIYEHYVYFVVYLKLMSEIEIFHPLPSTMTLFKNLDSGELILES